MIIEIDDVGTGHSLFCFGMGILTGEHFKYLELKNIEDIVPATISALVDELNIKSGEVHLCQGNLLDKLANKLIILGFKVKRVKIEGELQDRLDEAYRETLRKSGIPEHLLEILYDYHHFPGNLSAWVFISPETRMHYLSSLPQKRGFRIEYKKNKKEVQCFECRKPIKKGELKAAVVVTNGNHTMCTKHVHKDCIKIENHLLQNI